MNDGIFLVIYINLCLIATIFDPDPIYIILILFVFSVNIIIETIEYMG